MKVTIMRHAETPANRERIIQGHQGGTLSDYGKKQAKRVSKRLMYEHIDIIYTSDLKRAVQTTQKIVKRKPGIPVIVDKRIREKGAGILEGYPIGTAKFAALSAGISEREYKPEGGESWIDVASRAEEFWNDLLKKYFTTENSKTDKNPIDEQSDSVDNSNGKDKQPVIPHILIVSHSGLIQELLTYIFTTTSIENSGEVNDKTSYRHSLLHTGIFTFYFSDIKHMTILRKNDVMHLKGLKKKFKKTMKRNMIKSPKNRLNRSSEIGPPQSHSPTKSPVILCSPISSSQKSRSIDIADAVKDTICCSTEHL